MSAFINIDTANSSMMDVSNIGGKHIIHGLSHMNNFSGQSYSNAFGDWFKKNVIDNPFINPVGASAANVINQYQKGTLTDVHAWETNNPVGYVVNQYQENKATKAQKAADKAYSDYQKQYAQQLQDAQDATRMSEALAAEAEANNNLNKVQTPAQLGTADSNRNVASSTLMGLPSWAVYAGSAAILAIGIFVLVKIRKPA